MFGTMQGAMVSILLRGRSPEYQSEAGVVKLWLAMALTKSEAIYRAPALGACRCLSSSRAAVVKCCLTRTEKTICSHTLTLRCRAVGLLGMMVDQLESCTLTMVNPAGPATVLGVG